MSSILYIFLDARNLKDLESEAACENGIRGCCVLGELPEMGAVKKSVQEFAFTTLTKGKCSVIIHFDCKRH